jgi:ankyrin repeat protein
MEQQQTIHQLQAQLEHSQQHVQELQQQLQQYQQQESAPPAEEQQVEEQHVEPPAPPPQLPDTSDEMQEACECGDILKIASLIGAGERPNSVAIDDGCTPVMIAIENIKTSAAKVLFGFGADLSLVNSNGENVLHLAASSGNSEAANWVLDNSTIGINSTDNNGMPAAMNAIWSGSLNCAILLFERGALISMVNNDGTNMLHFAANNGDAKAVKWLLENSTIDINSTSNIGNTPMMKALESKNLDIAKLLVERGANLFMKNDEGTRAIDTRSYNHEQLGPQVLLHAKELRWSAVKEFILLAAACQSQNRRVVNLSISMNDEEETILKRFRSVRLAASIFTIPGRLRHVGSYIIRSDIIVRDKKIPKPPDAVKLRVEAALKAAAGSSSSKKRGRSTK